MEILGIGPGEFILILILLLVVVGPERLPQLARQVGGMLVRARNWLQTSPDAALVLRARQELEAELASIKTSLMEVQSVRDEVLGAAKQLEESVSSITSTKIDLNELVNSAGEQTIAPPSTAASADAPAQDEAPALADDTPLEGAPEQPAAIEPPSPASAQPSPASAPLSRPAEAPHANGTTPAAAPALAELETINVRLHAIMSDLWALQEQLKQRGALEPGWQPPSWNIQLPAAEPAPPVAAAAPEEDEKVLAARKLLEQFAPMQVAYHAPPAPEPVVEAATEEAGAPAPLADPLNEPETPTAAPAKTRKRRAARTAAADTPSAAEAPELAEAAEQPATPKRRRRARAAEELETVATEEAS
jgi:Sec-independent protein translocase protein TatA